MKKLLIFPILFVATGCLSRMTERLDVMTEQLNLVNSQLAQTNRRLESIDTSTTKMARIIPGN